MHFDFALRSHKRLTLLIEDAQTTRQQHQIYPIQVDEAKLKSCKYPADVQLIYRMQKNNNAPIMDKIRYARLIADFKQRELAQIVGIDRCTLIRLENGQVSELNMKTETLIRIAVACGFERTFCCNQYHSLLANDVGRKIKEYRKTHHLTQIDLGKQLNVHKKTISRWEHNLQKPSVEVLMYFFPEHFDYDEQSTYQ